MVQFQILSGKQAGLLWEARRFPVRVGRAAGNDLQLEDEGVWDEHFQITVDSETGFSLTAHPGAMVALNQTPVPTARLRNGDLITAGAAKLSFRLSETRQSSLRLREALVWALVVGVSLGQFALIAWLLS
jgi:pSer/pThr/pTyr-binding forkhead associated (FHA) protein